MYGTVKSREAGALPFQPLPDPCGVRKMRMREYCEHIAECREPECQQRRENHREVAARYGVEWPKAEGRRK